MGDLASSAAAARKRLARADSRRGREAAELAANVERLRIAVDPELAALHAEHQAAEQEAAYDRHLARKWPGARGGGMQCAACKRIKRLGEHQCTSCGYLDGAGYLGVPAQTGYLERWR